MNSEGAVVVPPHRPRRRQSLATKMKMTMTMEEATVVMVVMLARQQRQCVVASRTSAAPSLGMVVDPCRVNQLARSRRREAVALSCPNDPSHLSHWVHVSQSSPRRPQPSRQYHYQYRQRH